MNMKQQVNLYLYFPKIKRSFLSFNSLLIIYVGFFIILFIAHLNEIRVKNHLVKKIDEMNARLEHGQQKLAQTATEFPSLNAKELDEAVEKIRSTVGANSTMLQILKRNTKFSDYLATIANASIQGAWLTQITISDNGEKIALRGRAIKATDVQQLVEQLNHQPLFAGKFFTVRELLHETAVNENNQANLSFYIATKEKSA